MFFFKKKEPISIRSHVDGSIIALENVPDAVFSTKAMGDGFAVIASSSTVKAPVDGTISLLVPTNHAVGIRLKNNVQILIHIGLDSATTKPENFNVKVQMGQEVKIGDSLIEIDPALLADPLYIPCVLVENPNNAVYSMANINTDAAAGTKVVKFK